MEAVEVIGKGRGRIIATFCPPPPKKATIRVEMEDGREVTLPLFSARWRSL